MRSIQFFLAMFRAIHSMIVTNTNNVAKIAELYIVKDIIHIHQTSILIVVANHIHQIGLMITDLSGV